MDSNKNRPAASCDEYTEDPKAVGFVNPQLPVKHEAMNSVVMAEKP